jgi:peptide-methionine (S)-S-oxide reductase
MISSFKRGSSLPVLVLIGLLSTAAFFVTRSTAEEARNVPAPAVDEQAAGKTSETAVIAGGCFWGVQGVFQHVAGVTNAVSGYAGGGKDTAEYETVSTGQTGHAESVRITYDPSQITYGQLLRIYFSVAHNPTELNRQGPDSGTQYRSAIFAQDAEQAKIAKAYIAELDQAKTFGQPLATKIELGRQFFPAEGYHQDYLTLHPQQPYIAYNDIPKVEALKATFPQMYRDSPVLVSSAGLTE